MRYAPDPDDTVVLPTSTDDTVVLPTVRELAGAERVERNGAGLGTALKWSYLITTGGYAVTAILTFVLAAILEPREFGVLTMALVWVTLAQMLLQHGPTMAVIQQDDITEAHVNAAFWSTMGGAVGFSLLFVVTAPLWAALNGLPELTPICLALTPIVALQALSVIPDAVLRRRMQMRGIAIRVLVCNLTGGIAGVGCALAGLGVWSLVVQQLIVPTLYAVMLWSVTDWRPRIARIRAPLRDIRRTSLQTYAGSAGFFLSSRTDVILMGLFFGPVVIGLYRFAARFADMVIDLTARGLQQVSLPHLARHNSDKKAFAHELGRLMHGVAVLAYPMLGIVAGVATPLVLFIGEQWAEAGPPLRILCVVSGLTILGSLFGPALQAAQRAGIPALFTWATAGCSAGAMVVASRASSDGGTSTKLMAVAWAMLGVQAIVVSTMGYVVFRRVLDVSPIPTIVAAAPGVLSGVLAAVAGSAVSARLEEPLGSFLTLAISGTVAGAVALVVLLTLDRSVRTRLSRRVAQLRRRQAAEATT